MSETNINGAVRPSEVIRSLLLEGNDIEAVVEKAKAKFPDHPINKNSVYFHKRQLMQKGKLKLTSTGKVSQRGKWKRGKQTKKEKTETEHGVSMPVLVMSRRLQAAVIARITRDNHVDDLCLAALNLVKVILGK